MREAEILADLGRESAERWPLIIAADVLCYFGALETVLAAVHGRLQSGGWFVFSTEELLPDHDGIMPGNGSWAPHRQGRYAHSLNYVHEAAWTAGFRVSGRTGIAHDEKPAAMSSAFCSSSSGWPMTIDIRMPEHSPSHGLPLDPGAGDQEAARGMALLRLGLFEEALVVLRLAVELGDDHPPTMLNLAIAEDRVGDRGHARRLMQKVAARFPDWDEPILRLAESLRASNEIAAAEEAYRHVLDLNPGRPRR